MAMRCPVCDSAETVTDYEDYTGDEFLVSAHCNDCPTSWDETYGFVDYENVSSGGSDAFEAEVLLSQ